MRMPDGTDAGATGGRSGEAASSAPAGGDFAALAPDLTARIGTILEAVQREADRMLDEARGEAQRQVDVGKRQADGLLADRQRRIAQLSDTLIERTEGVVAQIEETALVRESFGRLLRALAEAADRVTAEITAAPMPPPAPPEPAVASDPFGAPEPAVPPPFTQAPTPPPPPPTPLPRVPEPPPDSPAEAAPANATPAGASSGEPATEAPPAPAPPSGDRAWIEARQAAIQMAAAGNTRAQVEAHLRGFLNVSDPSALLDQVFGAATAGEARVPWAIAPAAPAWHPDSAGG
jgi:hypothetical protein